MNRTYFTEIKSICFGGTLSLALAVPANASQRLAQSIGVAENQSKISTSIPWKLQSAGSNTPPTIQIVGTIIGSANRPTDLIPFQITDLESPPDQLKVSAKLIPGPPSNPLLLNDSGILLSGSGNQRFLQLTPTVDQLGSVTIQISVSDENQGQSQVTINYRVPLFVPSIGLAGAVGLQSVAADVDGDGELDWLSSTTWLKNLGGTNFARAGSVVRSISPDTALALGDPDNNGRLDFAMIGNSANQPTTLILTNAPSSVLTSYRFGTLPKDLVPGYFGETLKWIDFDLDGDVDLVALGSTSRRGVGQYSSSVWRNEGGLQFLLTTNTLPAVHNASMAWTDYDLDGDPDVLIVGTSNSVPISPLTVLYLNDGTGTFTNSGTTLPQLFQGEVAWGDFDLDGRTDLFLSGSERGLDGNRLVSHFYRQNPDHTLTLASNLTPMLISEVDAIDLNSDGLLDLVTYGAKPDSLVSIRRIFLNRGGWIFEETKLLDQDDRFALSTQFAPGDFDRDGVLDFTVNSVLYRGNIARTNRPPNAPSRLRVQGDENGVVLSWSASEDPNQVIGLSYNVRVGRLPGGSEIISPLALSSGRRLVVEIGNANQSQQRRLRNLAPGTYFWSVQAVDHSFEGGPFAPEQSFTIPGESLAIESITLSNGKLNLTIGADIISPRIVEVSTDLSQWHPVFTNQPPATMIVLEIDLLKTGNQFFRVRSPL